MLFPKTNTFKIKLISNTHSNNPVENKGYVYTVFLQGSIIGCCMSSGSSALPVCLLPVIQAYALFACKTSKRLAVKWYPHGFTVKLSILSLKVWNMLRFLRKRKQPRALKTQNKRTPPSTIYVMGQFNSRNCPVNAKFDYYAFAPAVAFEILSLWSYALREIMTSLPKTVLKSFSGIPRGNVALRWMSGIPTNLCPCRDCFNFWKSRKFRSTNGGEEERV
jgi:hypothetical protein